MKIIELIVVTGKLLGLITITGFLTVIALISWLLEFFLLVVPPIGLLLVQKSRISISSSIAWCGQMTCRLLSRISSMCPSESRLVIASSCTIEFPSNSPSYNHKIGIGVVPVSVPYTMRNIDTEHLEEFHGNDNEEILGGTEENQI
ncbi:uncharacterized protein LOC135164316 isoform X2 [Diachasmimorpha longicaudata]|uniref:uncharacterized protein LOC135164316 isoform X2 n=1 Tax=Diachasmimorpha longicaudata TaxID=58733 RepID=UPI0030B8CDB6